VVKSGTFTTMAKKVEETESVKISKVLVEKVRKNKDKTDVPIRKFIEGAIKDKFKKQKK